MPIGPVFLSYHRPDWDAVRSVADQLRAYQIETFVDRTNLAAGLPWPEALERAISGASAVVVFIGEAGQGLWQKREVGYALTRQAAEEKAGRAFPVIPVLLPGADPTPGFLFLNNGIDLRAGQVDAAAISPLVDALKGKQPTSDLATHEAVCPYRGLRRFREDDGGFFFGRDASVDELLDRVMREKLTVLIGASGSGKSSLVHAGLLPRLRRRQPPETTWDTAIFRPGVQPFHRLTESLIPLLEPRLGRAAQLAEAHALADSLANGSVNLDSVVRGILEESRGSDGLVLVVDQFEEVLTVAARSTATTFVDTLIRALSADLRILLVLRADFYGQAIALGREFSDRLPGSLLNLGPMGPDELREAIVKPATRVGLQVDPELVPIILEDLKHAPGGLPLLEHALLELWQARQGPVLTVEAYQATGGVAHATARRAELTYQQLSPAEQSTLRRVMLRLTVPGQDSVPGQDTADTRRRAVFEDLVSRTSERELVERVVQTFTDARLLTITADPTGQGRLVDVAHEALIGGWPRLREWIDADRDSLRIAHRLATSAREWLRLGKDEGALCRGAVFDETWTWATLNDLAINDLEREFLSASREVHDREEAREQLARFPLRRSVVIGALIALAVATGVPIVFELPDAIVSAIRVATLLVLNIGVLITVQFWLSRSLLFSRQLWYLAVYRQRRLPTLLAGVVTLWYATTLRGLGNERVELNLAYVPADAFVQYIVIVVLLTSVLALACFVLTWQVGTLSRRHLSNFAIGFRSGYAIVFLLVIALVAGTFAGFIPKLFELR